MDSPSIQNPFYAVCLLFGTVQTWRAPVLLTAYHVDDLSHNDVQCLQSLTAPVQVEPDAVSDAISALRFVDVVIALSFVRIGCRIGQWKTTSGGGPPHDQAQGARHCRWAGPTCMQERVFGSPARYGI